MLIVAGSSFKFFIRYNLLVMVWTPFCSSELPKFFMTYIQQGVGNMPKSLYHHCQSEPLKQGRMDPCFHILYAKFRPYHLNVAAEIKTPDQATHLIRILDARLYSLVVISDCLSYCFLLISLKQSGHSSLTSGIKKA